MAKHRLSLDIPDTLDKCVMCISDTSIYFDDKAIECPSLQITPPGFNCATDIDPDPTPGFCNLCLTACDLGLQTDNCGTEFCDLPDGIYIIRWSISPNEFVYVEYNYLRITNAMTKWQEILCALDLGACDPPVELKKKLTELRLIEMLIKAAKAMVEVCHNPDKGMQLFEYAVKRLNKLHCTVCL